MNFEGFWEEQTHMVWHYPLTFDLQGILLCMCSVSLVPGKGEWRFLNLSLKHGFAPPCLCHDYYLDYCHDYYLKVFTRDKHWLFNLFLLLLPFQRANRRLTVNALIGAHLSLVSGNASRCRHPA